MSASSKYRSDVKSIFITGAGSGIGRATAALFSSRGWKVGGCDLASQSAGLDETRRLCGDSLWTTTADVTKPDELDRAISEFVAHTGEPGLGAVFACAGVLYMGPYEQVDTTRQERLIDVNIRGVLHTVNAALPHLRRARGRILSMCSASAIYGMPELAVYSATKFFVRGLTEALNIELERDGIQVSDIMATYVKTPMVSGADHAAPSVRKVGVHVTADEVAEVAWQAIHGNRVHWHAGVLSELLSVSNWAMPVSRVKRKVVEWLTL